MGVATYVVTSDVPPGWAPELLADALRVKLTSMDFLSHIDVACRPHQPGSGGLEWPHGSAVPPRDVAVYEREVRRAFVGLIEDGVEEAQALVEPAR